MTYQFTSQTQVKRIDAMGPDTSPGGPHRDIPVQVTFIPVDPTLSAYQQFLADWEAGATVLSSAGAPLAYGAAPA